MTSADSPTAWLLEQVAVDEEHAQLALRAGTGRWEVNLKPPMQQVTDDERPILNGAESILHHIAGWDPQRVLAWCAAVRKIAEAHAVDVSSARRHEGVCERDLEDMPCSTMLALLQPYADRPGFDPRWRTP
jgi:hypothetical protein